MASAQVMPNSAVASSRKLGHLEAGKRRVISLIVLDFSFFPNFRGDIM